MDLVPDGQHPRQCYPRQLHVGLLRPVLAELTTTSENAGGEGEHLAPESHNKLLVQVTGTGRIWHSIA